jgi:hypothetical protein
MRRFGHPSNLPRNFKPRSKNPSIVRKWLDPRFRPPLQRFWKAELRSRKASLSEIDGAYRRQQAAQPENGNSHAATIRQGPMKHGQ